MPFRLMALLVSLVFLVPAASVSAGEDGPANPPLLSYATPELAPELFREREDAVRTASFCGACTTSDDCGSGWVCCAHGCSDGLKKCYNVVSCDKLAGETGALGLFASR